MSDKPTYGYVYRDKGLLKKIQDKSFTKNDLQLILKDLSNESAELLYRYYHQSYKALRIDYVWGIYKIIFEELAKRNKASNYTIFDEILNGDLFTSEDFTMEMNSNWYDSIYPSVSHMLFLEKTLQCLTFEMDVDCKLTGHMASNIFKKDLTNHYGKIKITKEELDNLFKDKVEPT